MGFSADSQSPDHGDFSHPTPPPGSTQFRPHPLYKSRSPKTGAARPHFCATYQNNSSSSGSVITSTANVFRVFRVKTSPPLWAGGFCALSKLFINKILYKKTKVAVDIFREKTKKENFQLIVAGGVAANESIRKNLSILSNEMSFETIYPNLKFCGDNAAMIAWAGIQRFKKNMIDDFTVSARSRWPLDENAPYMKGPGLKL